MAILPSKERLEVMPTAADKRRFETAQARYRAAYDARETFRLEVLARKYGTRTPSESWLLKGERDKLERYQSAMDRASDALFSVLDTVAPRHWRSTVPHHWIMTELVWADAVTEDELSVTPPPAYGASTRDVACFAAALVKSAN
jgi:hypothetical protein